MLFLAALLQTGCAGMVANSLMYPNRQPLVKAPTDYGLQSEDVSFESADGVSLAGWLIRGTGDDVVIITHPGGFTRYGFSTKRQGLFKLAEEDVEFLRTARVLVDAGYSVLMFDFRNHGESDTSPNGGITGLGLEEYRDVVAAVQFAAAHPDLAGRDIALVSFCQGANASIIATSKETETLRAAGLKALVAVQPISAGVFAREYGADHGIGPRILARAEQKMIERGSAPLDDMSPLPYAPDVFVPTLFVQSLTDPWTDLHFVRVVYEAIPEPKQVLWLEKEMERFATYNWFGDHPEPLLAFLDEYMGDP
jgi:dipeptidyl aminopeptidase/acylaminoacyl peptidase